jgi:hypothetical protein
MTAVARAETTDELIELMNAQRIEPRLDGHLVKHFRPGGPLEWCAPPKGEVADNDEPYILDVGTIDIWIELAKKDYEDNIMAIPSVADIVATRKIDLGDDKK